MYIYRGRVFRVLPRRERTGSALYILLYMRSEGAGSSRLHWCCEPSSGASFWKGRVHRSCLRVSLALSARPLEQIVGCGISILLPLPPPPSPSLPCGSLQAQLASRRRNFTRSPLRYKYVSRYGGYLGRALALSPPPVFCRYPQSWRPQHL